MNFTVLDGRALCHNTDITLSRKTYCDRLFYEIVSGVQPKPERLFKYIYNLLCKVKTIKMRDFNGCQQTNLGIPFEFHLNRQ